MRIAQPGEQVVCVNNRRKEEQPIWVEQLLAALEIGRLYTVTDVQKSPNGDSMFYQLQGCPRYIWGYNVNRFILPERKIHVRQADRRVSIPIRSKDRVD